jgi:single-strand DNA-binding protein
MASLNKVFLLGHLTRDPELRNTPNGAPVCDLGVAVNRTWMTKDGEKKEEVAFIDVTVWNRQADNCAKYLAKGRQVHVEGYLKMDSWQDKTTGEKRSKLKVEAEHVQFLGGPQQGGQGGGDDAIPARNGTAPPRRPVPPDESTPF